MRCGALTNRYVGPGGNDGNSGLTWALRKLTLNGVEDTPVVAGDTVYVGPGVYRETLTCDTSGGAGTEITYIGDMTGEKTDGVGGVVRITGSDNDRTRVRNNVIEGGWQDYRIFRRFSIDLGALWGINLYESSNWVVEDCFIQHCASAGIYGQTAGCTNNIIRRCVILFNMWRGVQFDDSAPRDNTANLIENCIIGSHQTACADSNYFGGVTVRNCLLFSAFRGVECSNLAVGQTVTVNNCLIFHCGVGVLSDVLGNLVEDFNAFHNNQADRTNVNVGGNSQVYAPLFLSPILNAGATQVSGFKFPWWFGELSEWSQVRAITGTNEPIVDLRGMTRPATAAKNSWGPLQFQDFERETGTVRTGSVSAVLNDAGVHQTILPVTGVSITVNVYVYREANYAGTNPRLIIKQPGQTDDVTTDAAAAGQWNLLTTTLTPAASPPYVVIELQSLNTAAAGSYAVFWDDLGAD